MSAMRKEADEALAAAAEAQDACSVALNAQAKADKWAQLYMGSVVKK